MGIFLDDSRICLQMRNIRMQNIHMVAVLATVVRLFVIRNRRQTVGIIRATSYTHDIRI